MTVMQTVVRMASRGTAVLMVCHDMEVVSDFAGRVAVMAGGRVLADRRAGEVFSDDALMARAGIERPQAAELARELARRVSPRFAGATEVSDIVSICEELICRG